MKRKIYHVSPVSIRANWMVTRAGWRLILSQHANKKDAIASAKKLAKAANLGQVIVHGKRGQIQTEYTYGKDPRATVG